MTAATKRVEVVQPARGCKTIRASRDITIHLAVDVSAFNAAVDRARVALAEFAARFLHGPEMRARFLRARRASPPPMPALGARYHQRCRSRTRRNR